MTKRVFNFNPGPATLPLEVMQKAQSEFVDYEGLGYGIMEASHRSPAFIKVLEKTEANFRELMGINDDYAVLFLQGGASLQFAMVPMNIAVEGKAAVYADTGSWTSKAIKEAKLMSEVEVVFSGKENNYCKIGDPKQWQIQQDAAYAYVCSNNTIFGTQYHDWPETGDVPLVADMSSDIMSRVINVNQFGLIFAGAQKNLGPSGVTLVIVRKDLAERASADVPTMLKYSTHIDKQSSFNTPPTFSIYMMCLVTDWLKEQGGVAAIEKRNVAKAQSLYEAIDKSDFYRGTANPSDRSDMNVCFKLAEEELEKKFIAEASAQGLIGLKGHRSVGGIRASIYNAMPTEGVTTLIEYMAEFERTNG